MLDAFHGTTTTSFFPMSKKVCISQLHPMQWILGYCDKVFWNTLPFHCPWKASIAQGRCCWLGLGPLENLNFAPADRVWCAPHMYILQWCVLEAETLFQKSTNRTEILWHVCDISQTLPTKTWCELQIDTCALRLEELLTIDVQLLMWACYPPCLQSKVNFIPLHMMQDPLGHRTPFCLKTDMW